MAMPLKAHVRGGRLVLDEPTDLPEGTEIALVPADIDDLDDEDRDRLHAALELASGQFASGAGIPADVALERLRRLATS